MPLQVDKLIASSVDAQSITLNGESVTPKYKVYSALLTQTGTSAPTAVVLENTLGYDITWQYQDVGVYLAVGNLNTFENGKFAFIQGAGNNLTLSSLWAYNLGLSNDVLTIECYNLGNIGPGTNYPLPSDYTGLRLQDDILQDQFIEIRVYN
jgi:hypothetical protein